MRIGVIGAGGTGGLYGGLLARAGHEVSFLARGAHLAAIQDRGLTVQSADFGTFSVPAHASDDPAELGQSELVLFAVKTYDLPSAAQAAASMTTPNGHVLTLQNGLDAPDQLADVVGRERVLIGTTALETTILEPGVIGHLTPGHLINVARYTGPPSEAVERTVNALKEAGMNANAALDGHRALWEKAFILIPMATLTSLCQSSIGPIRDLPETRALSAALLREVGEVARACGHDLAPLEARALDMLDRIPYTMKASMARDFERGRRTELDALTGALVRFADRHGLEIPTTRAAYAVLKLREQQAAGAHEALGTSTLSR
jgi:2-dehydropantoate 2-reductase